MVKALFDTNILIDYLSGVEAARAELARYGGKAISIVTWMEVMVGAHSEVEHATRAFLSGFHLIGLDETVADRAVSVRKLHRVKLPDAIVWASAQISGALLVTRNTKDFPANDPGIRHPYTL